jgi:anthranilate/para-aminobenzoate synthase component I
MNSKTRYPAEGPVEAARAMKQELGFVFLDSALTGDGSVSVLACKPDLVLRGRDWEMLEQELERRRRNNGVPGIPDGAAIGWIGYDGDFYFSFYDRLHVYLHDAGEWILRPEKFLGHSNPSVSANLDFSPLLGRDEFIGMVDSAQEFIAAGDIYQVCLSHPFVAAGGADPWAFYEMLRTHSPAPHAAFLDCGDLQIASASPESFLNMSGRHIQTRPIKGTRPRNPDQAGDKLSSQELLTSSKEIAELVMITDLERNDLGRVCRYGTVHVPELLRLESYEQVFHLVSTISGELRSDVSHVAALRECFPGGSISGAPKKRAMEIIRALEVHPRGIYTGAIGYFGYNGESRFSIAIRTAVFEPTCSHFHVGAGIVADSIGEKEWEETWHKAEGLLLSARACNGAQR